MIAQDVEFKRDDGEKLPERVRFAIFMLCIGGYLDPSAILNASIVLSKYLNSLNEGISTKNTIS